MEEFITTHRMNPDIDPVLDIWRWQVSVYLFLGGLTAGLLILGALSVLQRRKALPTAAQRLLVWTPVVLGVGLFSLFLDLEHKVHVYRFYTTFRVTSPMSWGSWILLLVMPVSVLLIAGTMRETWPGLYAWAERKGLRGLATFSEKHLMGLAGLSVALGVALGIYTGILLSAYGARPFWNTAILGPIFLVSGLSSGAALVQWFSRDEREHGFYTKVDVGLIAFELFLIGLMLIGMASGPERQQEAAHLVFGGELTTYFWVVVVMIGLALPLLLEAFHLKGRPQPRFIAPAFVLLGGLIFRFFIVEAGQLTTWIGY